MIFLQKITPTKTTFKSKHHKEFFIIFTKTRTKQFFFCITPLSDGIKLPFFTKSIFSHNRFSRSDGRSGKSQNIAIGENMSNNNQKKTSVLVIKKETVVNLNKEQLSKVDGGQGYRAILTTSCPCRR